MSAGECCPITSKCLCPQFTDTPGQVGSALWMSLGKRERSAGIDPFSVILCLPL